MRIKSLTIYCSSSNNLDLEYYKLATSIGKFLASKSIKIIYGGGNLGLMGSLSKTASESGGEVIGIIPNFLIDKSQDTEDLSTLLDGLKLVGDYLEKSILKPNNLSQPISRLQFINTLK